MIKKLITLLSRLLAWSAGLGLAALLISRLVTALSATPRIYTLQTAPAERAAIVFGAGLWRDGSPTPVLRDRVKTGADLYFAGKVEKLLLSGDNSTEAYNEPAAMRQYALELGVPDSAIVLDYAGRRTYDTCYRAKEIFGLNAAILVTQDFHLPRALFICQVLGLKSVGVPADLRRYPRSALLWWNLRELPATLTALFEVYITRPLPILGKPEPIFQNIQEIFLSQ